MSMLNAFQVVFVVGMLTLIVWGLALNIVEWRRDVAEERRLEVIRRRAGGGRHVA